MGLWHLAAETEKVWGGIGVPVEGRLRSQQLSGWKYNSCLQLTSSAHAIVLFVFFQTKLILALEKNYSTFYALYVFFDIYIYMYEEADACCSSLGYCSMCNSEIEWS